MPSSRPTTIPTVIHLIRQLKPQSILDVGVGFGKWGHLFREYTDINEAEKDPRRYEKKHWQVKIDGIEGHAAYITEMHRYLYDEIHLGDALQWMKKLSHYDLIFLGDVLEHFEKEKGFELLGEAVEKASKAVIISTPKYETDQADLCGNELERHRSLWSANDFRRFERATIKTIDRSTLLVVLVKPGVPAPICKPPLQPKPADARRLRLTKEELVRHIPLSEIFILVDEEQLRSELPHTRAIPFLERNGQYWGPPADDQNAVQELERLRKEGAGYIAFTWPAFWWLDHYSSFQKYLRTHFRALLETEQLIVFDLRQP